MNYQFQRKMHCMVALALQESAVPGHQPRKWPKPKVWFCWMCLSFTTWESKIMSDDRESGLLMVSLGGFPRGVFSKQPVATVQPPHFQPQHISNWLIFLKMFCLCTTKFQLEFILSSCHGQGIWPLSSLISLSKERGYTFKSFYNKWAILSDKSKTESKNSEETTNLRKNGKINCWLPCTYANPEIWDECRS